MADSERSSAVSDSESQQVETPLLRVVNPDATPEEVAALVAVLAALGSAASAEPSRRRTPEWAAHHRTVRTTHPHGPGGWRSSGQPR
jgi:hypothetical protein